MLALPHQTFFDIKQISENTMTLNKVPFLNSFPYQKILDFVLYLLLLLNKFLNVKESLKPLRLITANSKRE